MTMGGGASANNSWKLSKQGQEYLQLAKEFVLKENFPDAIILYNHAITCFETFLKNSLDAEAEKTFLIESCLEIGDIYEKQRQFENAKNYYKKAKELCDAKHCLLNKATQCFDMLDKKEESEEEPLLHKLPSVRIEHAEDRLEIWRKGVYSALEKFLDEVKEQVIAANQLELKTLLISYIPEVSKDLAIEKAADTLQKCLTQIGISVTLTPLYAVDFLQKQLTEYEQMMILCTPSYAKFVTDFSEEKWKEIINGFAKGKLNSLHALLCNGGFEDTAKKIVDSHYLVRMYQKVVGLVKDEDYDPTDPLQIFIDLFANFSGNQGLGILPDLLNLPSNPNPAAYAEYKNLFGLLGSEVQQLTLSYKLNAYLKTVHNQNSLKHYFDPDIPDLTTTIPEVITKLLDTPYAKTGLLLCPTVADTILTGLALEYSLMKSGKSIRVLSINCADYKGEASYNCIQLVLQRLKFTAYDINALKQNENGVIVILKNYEQLGAYDNLYVKNQLANWKNIKLLVTCCSEFFQHRSYDNCFLSDPSNPNPDTLQTHYINHFAPETAQKESLRFEITSKFNVSVKNSEIIGVKRHAQQKELSIFLRNLNRVLVQKDFLKTNIQQNPQVFISYAWEKN